MRSRFSMLPAIVLLLLTSVCSAGPLGYFDRLEQRVEQWRADMPAVQTSAHAAAKHAVEGGKLYIAGPQVSFLLEGLGRSGGLMMLKRLLPSTQLTESDTVLAAYAGNESDAGQQELIELAKTVAAADATLVLFSSSAAELPELAGNVTRLPTSTSVIDAGQRITTASVSNAVGLWAWVGQFIAGCVEAGKMPALFESHGMPGGRDRSARYRPAGPFHESTHVTPEAARTLSTRYLDALADALTQTALQHEAFKRGSTMLRLAQQQNKPVQVLAIAHMFPSEMATGPTPAWVKHTKPDDFDPAGVAFAIQYQSFPWAIAQKVRDAGGQIIATASHLAPAEFLDNPHCVYINPHWQVYDAAVTLEGYDVRILPISGIIQSAIYWQTLDLATQ